MIESVKLHEEEETKIIPMRDMEPLDIGIVIEEDGGYRDSIVMRTASPYSFEVMDLSHPGADGCWTGEPTLEVRLLEKGTKITLVVK
jgi:hypothetical protein